MAEYSTGNDPGSGTMPLYVSGVGGPRNAGDVDWDTAPTIDDDGNGERRMIPVHVRGHTPLGVVELTLWLTPDLAAALRLVTNGAAAAAGYTLVALEDQMTMTAREHGAGGTNA